MFGSVRVIIMAVVFLGISGGWDICHETSFLTMPF